MRYAVSHIDWSLYELTTEIIEAPSDVEAIKLHSKVQYYVWKNQDDSPCTTQDEMKRDAFDYDSMVNAVPIA